MEVIRKLSTEIIGQIAAGEVVERPAAAIKELVENSIDAGATNITVELRDGGINYFRVSDNGRGIAPEQIKMAFERHATSKLKKVQDLYDIHTLGFRGEALASIAAVAKVTCTTRTADGEFGTRAKVEAGEFTDIRQAASPVGTNLIVEDLFFNTPVRQKFLKKPAVEASLVSDYMLRLILSKPEIAFRFVSQGKTIYHSMGDGNIESAIFCLYGKDALKQMKKVKGHMNGILVEGYVGLGDLTRGNRQQQSFFVNGRYFKSTLLSKALESGCEGRMMIGRFPMCALFLDMSNQLVDVNVHPNKLEVRFQNESNVYQAIETLVSEAMHQESLGARLIGVNDQPPIGVVQTQSSSFHIVPLYSEKQETQNKPEADMPTVSDGSITQDMSEDRQHQHEVSSENIQHELARLKAEFEPIVVHMNPTASSGKLSDSASSPMSARVLYEHLSKSAYAPAPEATGAETAGNDSALPDMAQYAQVDTATDEEQISLIDADTQAASQLVLKGIVFDTYWIFELNDKLLLVDQHAAHERILYDQFMARYEGTCISQQLLSPQLVHLTAHEMTVAKEMLPLLAEAGFTVEEFDETSIAIQAIPTLFGENEEPKKLFIDAMEELQDSRGQMTSERMRKQVATMACKRAIKGGDKLNELQINAFMQDMLKSEAMPTCPHGRPIITEVTRYTLEKRFKRIQ
ncbi:MAG: DNA mismatch repair endonuclease MutL [Clostridiales bacterium]|nr:DNA mismatch repair endonuclease MutL [Clostridiales bacterium]